MSKKLQHAYKQFHRAVSAMVHDGKPFEPTHTYRSAHQIANRIGAWPVEVKGVLTNPDGTRLIVYRFEYGYGLARENGFDGVPLREWKPNQIEMYEESDGQVAMII
jgi:hypothetical protein